MSDTRNSDGVPQEMWAPRTDAGARKLVGEVHKLRSELKGYVTHKHMMAWVGVAALAIVSGAWLVAERAADTAKAVSEKAATSAQESSTRVEMHLEAHEKDHKQELDGIREEMRDGQNRIETKVDRVIDAIVTGRRGRN